MAELRRWMRNREGQMSQRCDLHVTTLFQSFWVGGWQLFTVQVLNMEMCSSNMYFKIKALGSKVSGTVYRLNSKPSG